jgi:hypothetical protein
MLETHLLLDTQEKQRGITTAGRLTEWQTSTPQASTDTCVLLSYQHNR